MILLALSLAVLASIPFLLELRRIPITKDEREKAPGEFVRLTEGLTHYRWIGPARGPALVAIHGLTTPSQMWTEIAEGLARLGYRVLVYDLYGRGYSDSPRTMQGEAHFIRQLEELLVDQGLRDHLTLLGYSMGGSIATAFAAKHPDRIHRVLLLSPAGIAMNESGFDRFCRTVPGIGDWLHGTFAPLRLERDILSRRNRNGGMEEVQLAQLRRRGFVASVLSSQRYMLSRQQEEEHRFLAHQGLPMLSVWAAQDSVIPLTALGKAGEWNRDMLHEVVPDADHSLPYGHPEEVVKLLREMMRLNR